jgi:hypothetical protein
MADDMDEGKGTKQKGRGFRDRKGKDEEISNARYDSLEPASGA